MQQILDVTAPIYLLIAIGFLAVWRTWISAADIRVLGQFTLRFSIPALLFGVISRQPIGAILNGSFLAAYAAGSLLALVLAYAVARRMRHRAPELAAMMALGASAANSGFIGYPIAAQVIGPSAGIALALCVFVENLMVLPVGLALADAGGARQSLPGLLTTTLRGLVRNPLILATLAGLAVSALEWPLPSMLDRTLDIATGAAPPIALFVIGGSLVGLRLSGIRGDLALITTGKLLLHPLCVLLMVWLLPPMDPVFAVAAVLFASMPMMSIFPMLAQRYGHEGLCSAALLAATVTSFVTVSMVVAVVPSFLPTLPFVR